MKKVHMILKPFLAIIFAALMLLSFMNNLAANGANLAVGIIAVILAAFYLIYGVLIVVIPDKMSESVKKGLRVTGMALFPIFFFVIYLVTTINGANNYTPTGWTIAILIMIVSVAFALVYAINAFIDNSSLKKLNTLLAFTFILCLLLDILFDALGNPAIIGNITMLIFVLYVIYSIMLLDDVAEDAGKALGQQPEEKAEEKAPVEENKEEEPKAEEPKPEENAEGGTFNIGDPL